MKKAMSYRLFGLGAVPKKVRPLLKQEGILLEDEGIPGWFLARNVRSPGRRYIRCSEGFSGCLVITQKRVLCYTYGKRQIHIENDDFAITKLHVSAPDHRTLSIRFESSDFRKGWEGEIEFRFRTKKTLAFCQKFRELGAAGGYDSSD
jgi:hypothetical protein